jgi:acetylornithine deacetylase/succinyl-diaminopimelate desuccinylase-like protein
LCRIRPWELPLADLVTEADFPGVEVQDTWALGMVGKLPGSGSGRSLMFGGHVEVVPPGDFAPGRLTTRLLRPSPRDEPTANCQDDAE